MQELTLEQANSIIESALVTARKMEYRPLAVVVLDAGGHVVAAQRQNGASLFRYDIAFGKAWAAVAMGVSSRALAVRAKDNPTFFVTLAASAHERFVPHPGGVLIRDADHGILGAVGASGGTADQDEACCVEGVQRAGLVADFSE